MNHFITGRLRLFAFISGLLLALNAFSLNLKIEPTISSPVSDSRYNDVIVAHNDIYYAMLDSKIQWRIKYEDWKTDENLELRYIAYSISIFNEDGKKYTIREDTLRDLSISEEGYMKAQNFSSENPIKYEIVATPAVATEDGKDLDLTSQSISMVLEFVQKPLFTPDFMGGKTSVYEGEQVSLGIGTLPNELYWGFSWKIDNETTNNVVWSKTFSIDGVRAEKKVSLTATCLAPDGKTQWYEETFTDAYTYIVYEKPELSIDLTATSFKDEAYDSEIIKRNGISYLLEGANERDIMVSMKYDKSKFQLASVSYDVTPLNGGSPKNYTTESLNMRNHEIGQYKIEVKNATWKAVGFPNEEMPQLTDFNYPSYNLTLREKPLMRTVSWDGKSVHMWAGKVLEPLKINPLEGASENGQYVWKVDNSISSDGDNEQWEGAFSCTNGQVVDKVVSLNASYPDPELSGINWYEKEYKHTYKVYGAPIVKFNSSDSFDEKEQEYNHYSKETAYVDLNITGGYATNWNYKWTKNKETISGNNRKNYSYTVRENKEDTVYCDTIFVEFENRLPDNDVPYTGSLTCYVRIWPEASVVVTLSDSITIAQYEAPNYNIERLGMYNGFTRKVSVNMFGGNEGNWTCQWYKNNSLPGNEISDADGILSVQSNGEYQIHPQTNITYVCIATNTLPNGKKLPKQYRINVTVYPKPEVITATKQEKYNLLAGVEGKDRKTFEVIKSGGYDNGWTFTWTANNKIIESAEGSLTHEYVATNTNEKPDTIVHKLVYSNILDGEVGCQGEFEYKVVDYSTPVKSVMNKDYKQQMREGDDRIFSVTPPKGGNPDGWYYKWRRDYKDITPTWIKWNKKNDGHERGFVIYLDETGNDDIKRTEAHQYDFVFTNLDAEGHELVAPDVVSFPVKVYRRPKKPSTIVQKGEGKSDMFIMLYNVEQTVLENAGILHEFYMMNGEHLYTGTERVIFSQANPNYLRGRSLWKYDDFDCYSDPVGVGTMDDTKAPDYIAAVNTDADMTTQPMSVTAYSMTGEAVKTVGYAMQKDYNETEMLQGLPKGMYILHCISGNQRVVKKVVVK